MPLRIFCAAINQSASARYRRGSSLITKYSSYAPLQLNKRKGGAKALEALLINAAAEARCANAFRLRTWGE